jgi:hypothetical protein
MNVLYFFQKESFGAFAFFLCHQVTAKKKKIRKECDV